jgi:hypothetical protein
MTEAPTKTENEAAPKQSRLQEILVIASILTVTLTDYIGTLWYQFVYDDQGQIVQNSYIQYWRHVPLYFNSHVWVQLMPRTAGNYYRPLFLLWLRLNDAVFGLRPMGWHATAIALHLLTTLLVYAVVRKITRQMPVAAIAALIFGLHPIHAEVVAWISGATESLCAVFVLTAFLAYLKSREGNAAIWVTISCVFYALAVFSKETGIVLPALVFGHCWIYWEDGIGLAANAMRRFMASVRSVLAYGPVALFYLVARVQVLHGLGHILVHLKFRDMLLCIPSMVGFYVKKWFLPIRLNEFYDMPYWSTINFWHVIMPAILVIGLCAVIWHFRDELGARDVEFAMFWVIVPILPVLDARMLPEDQMVHDRYFYLPSVGASLLVALAVARWTRAPRGAPVFGFPISQLVVALALAATLGGLTVRESGYWSDNYSLVLRGHQLSPRDPVGRLNYGAELITHGDYDGARAVFAESLAAEPNDPAPYMSLWRIAYAQQDYPEAVRLMLRANQLKKNNPDAYANLALTYLHMDRLDDALVNMRTAAQLRPTDPTFLFAYGVMLEAKGDCALASDQFRAALEIRPGEAYAQLQLTRCQQILSRTSHN